MQSKGCAPPDTKATKAFDVEALSALWTDDIVSNAPGREPHAGPCSGSRAPLQGRDHAGLLIGDHPRRS
jgi:hypothetical protein